MDKPPLSQTHGIDHIGLTVSDVDKSVAFFTGCLGWIVTGGNSAYPSAYLTDGTSRLTLWAARAPAPMPFDRHANIGLHHLALKIHSRDALDNLFARVTDWPGVQIEFAPEPSGNGPKIHFMVYEPGGNRLEFAFDPR